MNESPTGKYVYLAEQMKDGLVSSHTVRSRRDCRTLFSKTNSTGISTLVGIVTSLIKTGDELLAWMRVEKNPRVVGTILGHGPSVYEDPHFLKLLYQSIRSTARRC